ncbi:MAG: MinD/ParA family protein [Defluviitaleaceae bacterium]|nr:MinD/ParA family protein [Defluviitaleaceae bacterium]
MMDQANKLRDLVYTKNIEKTFSFKNRLITVTSGKGGVGKSNFTLNLAICLSKAGNRVIIIDADFAMANIEVLFGVVPGKSLLNVLRGESTISEIIIDGPAGISLVSGGSGFADLAALNEKQVDFFLESFTYFDENYDIVLIDTGAGASHQVINMVKASQETIIITTPEPTALTDAYAMIKILKSLKTMPEMFIVINRIDNRREGEEIYSKLNRVSHRFLGLELKLLGFIPDDNFLLRAVKKQEPLNLLYPKSPSAKSIQEICNMLLSSENRFATGSGTRSFIDRFLSLFSR